MAFKNEIGKEFMNTFMSKDKYIPKELVNLDRSSDKEHKSIKYPQFNITTKVGFISIKLGVEFGTLRLFKEAMKDYNIFLGRPVKCAKNDNKRCKVIYLKKGCG